MPKPPAIYLLDAEAYTRIYGETEQAEIAGLCEVAAPPLTPETMWEHRDALARAEIIFSGWGAPKLDAELLAAMPNLRAVFYGAGTIRYLVTEAFWQRGIPICTASVANALPVSEFVFAQVTFALKHGWHYHGLTRAGTWKQLPELNTGTYRSTVGLVGFGLIARMVAKLLKSLEVKTLVYDPFLSAEEANEVGVSKGSLEDLFGESDVVSIHLPWLPETENMITGELIGRMKPYATLLNTARGAVVNEPEMIATLRERTDLIALLDVTYPEPPAPDSPLFELPNVLLTPHIAGSIGTECHRMAAYMIQECRRFLAGEPLEHQVTKEQASKMA